jgi:hypothetical protein
VSQEKIDHVECILHSVDRALTKNFDEVFVPRNARELEEIERHLKHNAHIFNSQSSRRALEGYARLPHINVDFDTKIERAFEAFGLNELISNCGLQGKQLKMLQTLVEELKQAAVDSLIMIKQDTLGTRMHEAGYLRYTNKTAHTVIQDRHASDCSGIASRPQRCNSLKRYVSSASTMRASI